MMKQYPPPHFLRRCNKFPRSVGNREHTSTDHVSKLHHDPTTTHHYHCHRKWGHAFELSVSLKKLLKTKNAAEDLLEFLQESYNGDDDDDDDETRVVDDEDEDGEELQHGYEHVCINKVIWMSKDVFIIWLPIILGEFLNPRYLRQGASTIYSIEFDWCSDSSDKLWICQQPSIITTVERTPVRSDVPSSNLLVKEVMDALLRLLARHKSIGFMKINTHPPPEKGGRDSGAREGAVATELFPASLDALKAFVGKTKRVRSLCLQHAGLSTEQWHAVASNCHPNVTIVFDYLYESEGFASTEPGALNHCPRKIKLCCPDWALPDERQVLWTAIASTSSLKELEISFYFVETKEVFFSLIKATSRNRCLQRLELTLEFEAADFDYDLTIGEWELLCGAVASHPTLQEVKVFHEGANKFSTSPEKDRILLQKICQNTTLRKFEMPSNFLCNRRSFVEAVNPVLDFNCFRKVVQAIHQESDIVSKQILFTAILLSAKVRRRPDHRFLLFKQNVDLLEQYSIEGKLSSDWNKTMRHLESLQEMMQARGMAIPYSLTKEDESSKHGRSRKRSRSSAVRQTP